AAQREKLQIASPIRGIVLTPRLRDLIGFRVEPGATLAEVADLSTFQARIYIPEASLPKVRVGATAGLAVAGRPFPIRGNVQTVALASEEMDAGVMATSTFQGLRAPVFYVATVSVDNTSGSLKNGMTGTAKIFVQRRSIAGFVLEQVRDFVQRKVW